MFLFGVFMCNFSFLCRISNAYWFIYLFTYFKTSYLCNSCTIHTCW